MRHPKIFRTVFFLSVLIVPVLVISILFWNLTECSMSFLCHTCVCCFLDASETWPGMPGRTKTIFKNMICLCGHTGTREWLSDSGGIVSNRCGKESTIWFMDRESWIKGCLTNHDLHYLCKHPLMQDVGELEMKRQRLQKSILGWAEQYF